MIILTKIDGKTRERATKIVTTFLFFLGFFMSIAQAAMGAFFFMKYTYGPEVAAKLGWLPLASLILFIVAYSSGYANVPFLIMGELFPSKYR